jgi:hypothetical protein
VHDDDALCAVVGGVEMRFMIDSGALQNIIDCDRWKKCNKKGIVGKWIGKREFVPVRIGKAIEGNG